MKTKWLVLLLVLGARVVCASDYYVDCNNGSNGNAGTSTTAAWRTLLQVGISSFLPGDTINFKRDCTWNETLTPPSSGTNPALGGALIKNDSYGTGRAPHLTGYLAVSDQYWEATPTPNVWAATLYSATTGLSTVVSAAGGGSIALHSRPCNLSLCGLERCGGWGRLRLGHLTRTAIGGMTRLTTFFMYIPRADPRRHISVRWRPLSLADRAC